MTFQKISSHLCLATSVSCLTLFQILSFKTTWNFGTYLSKTLQLICFKSYLPKLPEILEAIFRNQVTFHFRSYFFICYLYKDSFHLQWYCRKYNLIHTRHKMGDIFKFFGACEQHERGLKSNFQNTKRKGLWAQSLFISNLDTLVSTFFCSKPEMKNTLA
jgi:hypothetical protein